MLRCNYFDHNDINFLFLEILFYKRKRKKDTKKDNPKPIGEQLKTLDLDGEIQLSCNQFKPQKAYPLMIFYIKKFNKFICRVIV